MMFPISVWLSNSCAAGVVIEWSQCFMPNEVGMWSLLMFCAHFLWKNIGCTFWQQGWWQYAVCNGCHNAIYVWVQNKLDCLKKSSPHNVYDHLFVHPSMLQTNNYMTLPPQSKRFVRVYKDYENPNSRPLLSCFFVGVSVSCSQYHFHFFKGK